MGILKKFQRNKEIKVLENLENASFEELDIILTYKLNSIESIMEFYENLKTKGIYNDFLNFGYGYDDIRDPGKVVSKIFNLMNNNKKNDYGNEIAKIIEDFGEKIFDSKSLFPHYERVEEKTKEEKAKELLNGIKSPEAQSKAVNTLYDSLDDKTKMKFCPIDKMLEEQDMDGAKALQNFSLSGDTRFLDKYNESVENVLRSNSDISLNCRSKQTQYLIDRYGLNMLDKNLIYLISKLDDFNVAKQCMTSYQEKLTDSNISEVFFKFATYPVDFESATYLIQNYSNNIDADGVKGVETFVENYYDKREKLEKKSESQRSASDNDRLQYLKDNEENLYDIVSLYYSNRINSQKPLNNYECSSIVNKLPVNDRKRFMKEQDINDELRGDIVQNILSSEENVDNYEQMIGLYDVLSKDNILKIIESKINMGEDIASIRRITQGFIDKLDSVAISKILGDVTKMNKPEVSAIKYTETIEWLETMRHVKKQSEQPGQSNFSNGTINNDIHKHEPEDAEK